MNEPASAQKGGLYSALRFTGIPPSWLEKRPKLPSRNWLIFIGVVTSIAGLYVDDRRKCKKIREEYTAKVRHLAEETLGTQDWPRKVTVYSCRYPEDHDHERSMVYFKRYVKPMLVAAAIDYDIINGNQYGALTGKVSDDIKKRRRELAGLQKSHEEELNSFIPLPGDRTPAGKARRQLEGGTVIIGRHSLKEYLEGVSRGWSGSAKVVDQEEAFAETLSDDVFDDPLGPPPTQESRTPPGGSLLPPPELSRGSANGLFGPIRQAPPPPPPKMPTFHMSDDPPATLPPQSPIGLVPFTNHLGFLQVPYMIYDFFTERHRVLAGCKAGYAIAMGQTRPMTKKDLDFDSQSEGFIKGSWNKLPKRIKESKESYYKDLTKDVKIARELAYGEREPTRAERSHPPKTEVELRTQRLKKELKWKEDLEGWEVLRGDVCWDERFEGVLSVFVDPQEHGHSF